MTTIKSFVDRLNKIGIKVELMGNYPWVYLDKVNDKKVWGLYEGNHGFTVFFVNKGERITNISVIFKKIREMLSDRVKEYEVVYIYEGDEIEPTIIKQLFYGTEAQCKEWKFDYDDYDEFIVRKIENIGV